MKKLVTLFVLLGTSLFVTSCMKDIPDSLSGYIVSKDGKGYEAGPTVSLKVSAESLTFLAEGGSCNYTITCNTSWTITSDQSWCTLSPSSGSGNSTITASVPENTSAQSRSATVTVKIGDIKQTIPVTQAGANQSSIMFTVNDVSFKMIRVDGGTFTMGATSGQIAYADTNELPSHSVTLSTYYMGETEVTQELWQTVMGSYDSFKGSRRPVGNVSWQDCQNFITKLNTLTGSHFRLPTEAEWEFAARGGNSSRGYRNAGSSFVNDVAWYTSNSKGESHNVAEKSPNELGLYDMSGNESEWCHDWYGEYSHSSQTDPIGPSKGSYHVLRGGSWNSSASDCRVSSRSGGENGGLRLAL